MVFTLGYCTQTLLLTAIRHVSATHCWVQNAETPGIGCNRRTSSDDGRSTETCLTGRMRASCQYHFRKTCQHLGGKILVQWKLTSLILFKGPIFCTFIFCLNINFSCCTATEILALVIHQIHIKLRPHNGCHNLKIFLMGKSLHLVTITIDSQSALGNISFVWIVPLVLRSIQL